MFEQPQSRRVGGALGAGIAAHAVAVAVVLIAIAWLPERVYEVSLPERLSTEIVWLPAPGPGGGGGGGNQMEEPPRPAELPGDAAITVPTPAPEQPAPEPQPEPVEPPPVPTLQIAALHQASNVETAPGAIESSQTSSSLGIGAGPGAGSGDGPGLGPGSDGGTGDGPRRPGNGVLGPRLLREFEPRYTADAMHARVQGVVWLDCVILPDGTVGDIKIVRSLDPVFGLDQEAVKAARQWRFEPGTRNGEPVPVLVTIELQFALR